VEILYNTDNVRKRIFNEVFELSDVFFDIETKRDGNALIISIKGRLVFPEADRAEGTIIQAINQNNVNVIFDFTGCEFIASSGYAIFIRIKKECDEKGLKVVFARCSDNVRRGFFVIGYQKIVQFFDTLEGAKNSFTI